MKKTVLILLALLALGASSAEAQEKVQKPPDNWATWQECQAAKEFRWYHPATKSSLPLGADEEIVPNPADSCDNMDVPEALGDSDLSTPGNQRWVKIEKGRPMIRDNRVGAIVRLAECRNRIWQTADVVNPDLAKGVQENVVVKGDNPPAPPPTAAPAAQQPAAAAPQQPTIIINNKVTVGRDEQKAATPVPSGKSWFSQHKKGIITAVGVVGGGLAIYCGTGHCGGGSDVNVNNTNNIYLP